MIFLRDINSISAKLLERIYHSSRHHQVRQRAHCLILAAQGVKVEELMKIFHVSYGTIYNWFNRWESEGIVGLYNQPGRGRKPTFNSEQQAKIIEWVNQEPRQLKKVVQKVKEEWGIEISTRTIKRILKMFCMSWHRMRRAVGGEPNPEEYKRQTEELSELKRKDNDGEIDLYYLDESGFSLIPSVPYAWQNVGEYLTIKSQRSRRLNVLGIMNRNNDLKSYVSEQSINSDLVIACIDAIFPRVDKPTVIVVDQSSIHVSDAVVDKLPEWQARGLSIFVLPAYSPQLNLIEILWRFIKYEWIEIAAYNSWKTFVESVERILREFGENYSINFV